MRSLKSVRRCLPCLGLTLLAALGGWLIPAENIALGTIVFIDKHDCEPNTTCGMVAVGPCFGGGWCLDSTTMDKFPKCMPTTDSVQCPDNSNLIQSCPMGTCSVGGGLCTYLLDKCGS